jgi:hypothetical protein
LQITHNKSTKTTRLPRYKYDTTDDIVMTSSMRGKKKQNNFLAKGTTTQPEDADRAAMAGGGEEVGTGEEGGGSPNGRKSVATKDTLDKLGRKRKRGHNNQELENEELSLDNPNGDTLPLSDESLPQLGILLSFFTDIDSNDMARLIAVIEHQFSLEILLKNQERKTIEAEKAKVETSLKQLEQCVLANGTVLVHVD